MCSDIRYQKTCRQSDKKYIIVSEIANTSLKFLQGEKVRNIYWEEKKLWCLRSVKLPLMTNSSIFKSVTLSKSKTSAFVLTIRFHIKLSIFLPAFWTLIAWCEKKRPSSLYIRLERKFVILFILSKKSVTFIKWNVIIVFYVFFLKCFSYFDARILL